MLDELVYLYAVGNAAVGAAVPTGLRGVAGAPVRVIPVDRLAAIVSSVDPHEFGDESLQRNLNDLTWLAVTARAHHAVIDLVWGSQPIAPLRLATVYRTDENVRTLLQANSDAFTSALDRIRGRQEWGVKAFAAAVPGQGSGDEEPDGAVGPGAAYLLRKRAARDRVLRERSKADDAAEGLHRSLSGIAEASRRYPPQDPRISGRRADMVLNAAYLVPDSDLAVFRKAVERGQPADLEVELTGPWVPYSFATLEEP
jgi:hypothetical protein